MDLRSLRHKYVTWKHHVVFPAVETADSAVGAIVDREARCVTLTPNGPFLIRRLELAMAAQDSTVIPDEEQRAVSGSLGPSVAFDDADVKFYLTADSIERARRRQAELRAKGGAGSIEQIQRAIEERDKNDESRTVGPLKPAEDAIVVDTTNMSIEQVVEKLACYVKEDPHFAKM